MTSPTILSDILRLKREELKRTRRAKPLKTLQAEATAAPAPRDFAGALRRPGVSLIAEIKRASPSKGPLRPGLDPAALALEYEAGGAAAISVLTEERYFQGRLDDLRAARRAIGLPVLRKDFIIDPYQVFEARAAGADAILLIAAALNDAKLASLHGLAGDLGMAVLVEVHDETELQRAIRISPSIIGINNRDLRSLHVDLGNTTRLRPSIPAGILVVAESGIHTYADVQRLAASGVDAMLVGESLVRAENTGQQIAKLLGKL